MNSGKCPAFTTAALLWVKAKDFILPVRETSSLYENLQRRTSMKIHRRVQGAETCKCKGKEGLDTHTAALGGKKICEWNTSALRYYLGSFILLSLQSLQWFQVLLIVSAKKHTREHEWTNTSAVSLRCAPPRCQSIPAPGNDCFYSQCLCHQSLP